MTTKSKRGQNEGSFYQRADGRWEALLTIPADAPGGPARRSFYGKTKAEAMSKMRESQRKVEQGLPIIPEKQKVGDFLDDWLRDVVKPSVRPSTYVSYAMLVKQHLKPGLGHHKLARLTPQQVQAHLNVKLASGLSARSVQYQRAVLRRALNQALKWDLVSRNVATLVEPPTARRFEIQPLSPSQARAFLSTVEGDRLEALYRTAIAMGLRQGEALGLQWSAIDLDAGTLTIRTALQRIDKVPTLVEPKTDRSRRTLPMPAKVIEALRAHRVRQLEERLFAGPRWDGSLDLVFTTPIGTPLDPSNVTKQFHAALKRAGLPRIRFHDLRHSCASLLLAQGVPARTIMETLGHSQISLTMNTYSHVAPEMLRNAADLMDRLLASNE